MRRGVRYSVPGWGNGELLFVDGALVDHSGPGRSTEAEPGPDTPEERRLVERLQRYFEGRRDAFADVDIAPALDYYGVDGFAREVLTALRSIPYGTTCSYGELADLAGAPRAARAVGTVMASGPLEIVIPYHRVVRSDGSVGSYGPGASDRKARLLALEAEGAVAST